MSQEQLCYIPCNLCNIVLAVSVPSSSLFATVTVRCGHCTNVWSVNMSTAALSLPPPPPISSNHLRRAPSSQDYRIDSGSGNKTMVMRSGNKTMIMRSPATTSHHVDRRITPEKRQRVPSAYNQFIKEEIQRIKASNPDISHREAFSTAAKNWAHFPHIHFGLMLETSSQPN